MLIFIFPGLSPFVLLYNKMSCNENNPWWLINIHYCPDSSFRVPAGCVILSGKLFLPLLLLLLGLFHGVSGKSPSSSPLFLAQPQHHAADWWGTAAAPPGCGAIVVVNGISRLWQPVGIICTFDLSDSSKSLLKRNSETELRAETQPRTLWGEGVTVRWVGAAVDWLLNHSWQHWLTKLISISVIKITSPGLRQAICGLSRNILTNKIILNSNKQTNAPVIQIKPN